MEFTEEKLHAMTDELREQMNGLYRFNALGEIHAYCDNLVADVTVAFDSAFRHLQRLQESMLGEISEYRNSLIEAQHQRAALLKGAPRMPLADVIARSFDFKEEITQMCEQERSDTGDFLISHIKIARELEGDLRKETMSGKFMRFKPNRFFDLVLDHVGSLEILENISPDCRRVEIHEESHIVHKNLAQVAQIGFMPNDRLVVCTLEGGLLIYRASDMSLLENLRQLILSFTVLPGERLVVGREDGELRIYDFSRPHSGGKRERDFVALDSNKSRIRARVFSLVLLPNGYLATSDIKGHIEVWDLNRAGTDKALVFCLNKEPSHIGVLSNGFLVSCTFRQDAVDTLKLWDLKTTQPLRAVDTSLIFVMSLLVLPNDQVALGSRHGNISIYDPIEMEQIWKFQLSCDVKIAALAYLPNGCLMAGDKRNQFHVWNLITGKKVQTLDTGVKNLVSAIRVSPDGQKIAFSGVRNELKIASLEFVSSP